MRSGGRVRSFQLVALAVLLVGAACSDDDGARPPVAATTGVEPSESPSPPQSSPPPPEKPGKPKKDDATPRIVEVAGGAKLTALPDKAQEVCSKGPPLSRVCPTLVPLVRNTNYLVDSFGKPGGRFQVLELAAGAPSNNDFSRNTPPRVAHVVIEAGDPRLLIDLGEPYPNKIPLDELLGTPLDQPQFVAPEKDWGWEKTLVLAPSFPSGGAHGDHLLYRFKEGGLEYVVSLHAWAPAEEAVRTLHAIVRSIKN